MSVQAPKAVAISFQKPSKNEELQQFEALFVYGVLNQLARFTEIQYKDMATLPEAIQLDPRLSYDDALAKLKQICGSTRTNYLFTGVLQPSFAHGQHLKEIKATVRLYEAKGNRYIVDEVVQVEVGEQPDPAPLNQLIGQSVSWILKAIYGDNHGYSANVPFSTSYEAMVDVLRAHQTNSNAEKMALYESALRNDPQMETAYYHLARLYRAENEYEKSVHFYRKTLEVCQGSARNRAVYATDAGIGCAVLGRLDLAKQWWMKAIEYDRTYINPYFNIANIYEDEDNLAQAEIFFVKAQELAPDDYRTFFNLARIYSKMGSWEKAITQYRRQLETEGQDPWCHSDVATCYLNLGDPQNAQVHLEKTVELDPDGEAGEYAKLILSGLGQ